MPKYFPPKPAPYPGKRSNSNRLTKSFKKYEKKLLECERIEDLPYRIEFRDKDGNVVSNRPIPLNPSGKPKKDLFRHLFGE